MNYLAKRAAYDVLRATTRDTFRSIAAAQKSASAEQMRVLSAQFLDAVETMPSEQVVGFVDTGAGDRRMVTAGNFAEVISVIHTGALQFIIVENGQEQVIPPSAVKALHTASKARARLYKIAPVAPRPAPIKAELVAFANEPAGVPHNGKLNEKGKGSSVFLRVAGWVIGIPMAGFLTLFLIVAIATTFFG